MLILQVLVFLKTDGGGGGVYDLDSPTLYEKVTEKMREHQAEIIKWNSLLKKIEGHEDV